MENEKIKTSVNEMLRMYEPVHNLYASKADMRLLENDALMYYTAISHENYEKEYTKWNEAVSEELKNRGINIINAEYWLKDNLYCINLITDINEELYEDDVEKLITEAYAFTGKKGIFYYFGEDVEVKNCLIHGESKEGTMGWNDYWRN